jgi:rhodanese-related sulfurtransferase
MSIKRHLSTMVASALAAFWLPQAAGQVMGDESCPYFAVDHASFATCDGARVARPAAVSFMASAAASELKQRGGQGVLFIDVRSRVEAAMQGTAAAIDFVVPYREAAHPMRWDSARGSIALDSNPAFLDQVHAAARAQGGGLATPVLLLCATGSRAVQAAEEMRKVGFTHVYVVLGGLDGTATASGWRAAALPVLAGADEGQLFGLAD